MRLFLLLIMLLIMISILPRISYAKSTVAGTVKEKSTGEYVIGASVMIYKDSLMLPASYVAAISTNKFGFYSIPNIARGEYWLIVRSLGYARFYRKITVGPDDLLVNAELEVDDVRLKEIIVEADKDHEGSKTISQVNISPSFINKMPALGGEVDVFRTLMLLPGVAQGSEISSGLYIRGGSPDQNLVLLDGVIVYNPTHLAGFLSSFNSDALRDVRLIKGAMPAEYGGRLSSVVDMTMKEGNRKEFTGAGAISLISSKLTVEGPLDENSSFMISGRRMYLDLLLGLSAIEDMPDYYFYDLNAKVNYNLGDRDRVFVSGYFARDVFGFDERREEMSINWGNATGSLRWMHIFNPKLFSNFSLVYTDYSFETRFEDPDNSTQNFSSLSQIRDFTGKGNFEYFWHKNHTLKTGGELTIHRFKVGTSTNFEDEFGMNVLNTGTVSTLDAAVFAQDEWISGRFTHNIGFRGYYFQEGNYFDIEPRLSTIYELTDDLSLKASFDIAHQYVHLVTNNGINLPTDLWFPSTKEILPQRSYQGVLGAEKTFNNGEYLTSIEVYYKQMDRLIEFKDNALFNFGMPDPSQFAIGEGVAYGVELFLNRRIGNLTGWIGYTLAWTERRFDDLNKGKWFPPRYDRRHDISIAATYNFDEDWEIGATWVFATGQSFTVPNGLYSEDPLLKGEEQYYYPEDSYFYSDRNGFRLPSYHRLDVNIMKKFEWFDLPFEFLISIYNVYNRKNPFSWFIDTEYNDQSWEEKKVVRQVTLFPIIPTIGLRFTF